MRTEQLALRVEVVRDRIARALAGEASSPAAVVWRDSDAAIVVHVEDVAVELGDGWLVVAVPMVCDQVAQRPVRAVFRLGSPTTGDGATAAFALDPETPAVLARRWGDALRDAIWNAVLDLLEAAVFAAHPDGAGRIAGFSCTAETLVVDVTT